MQLGEGKKHPNWREVKLSLFSDDMLLCINNSKESTKRTVRPNEQIHQSCKTQDQHSISVLFLCTSNEKSQQEIKKTIPFLIASKRIQY